MNSEIIEKSSESFGCSDNLRMQIKDADAAAAGGHTSESARIGDRLSRLMTEMMAAQGEILGLEAQLAAAAAAETALTKEKLKSAELQRMVSELKETNLHLRAIATEAEEKMQNLEKSLAEKLACEAMAELKKLKEEMEVQESKNREQSRYISLLETEVKQLMGESGKARDEVAALNLNIGKLKAELDEIKSQADRLLESQVENSLLKVELHKWRSKAAQVEAAEERCKTEKLALTRALQVAAAASHQATTRNRFLLESEHKKQGKIDINKADEQVVMMEEKVGKLERELMTATHKIREMRTRAEQAISRAEAAEKAKADLEDKIKRRKEKEKEKKKFFKHLREQIDSSSREAAASPDFAPVTETPAIQTLSNVLEIPF